MPGSTEKMPFQAFRGAQSILAFYAGGKIFCYFDIDTFERCTVKCEPDRIEELKSDYHAVDNPYNMSRRHWISIWFDDDMPDWKIKELVSGSYRSVMMKQTAKRRHEAE